MSQARRRPHPRRRRAPGAARPVPPPAGPLGRAAPGRLHRAGARLGRRQDRDARADDGPGAGRGRRVRDDGGVLHRGRPGQPGRGARGPRRAAWTSRRSATPATPSGCGSCSTSGLAERTSLDVRTHLTYRDVLVRRLRKRLGGDLRRRRPAPDRGRRHARRRGRARWSTRWSTAATPRAGLSAMQRCTGFPAATAAVMLAGRALTGGGVGPGRPGPAGGAVPRAAGRARHRGPGALARRRAGLADPSQHAAEVGGRAQSRDGGPSRGVTVRISMTGPTWSVLARSSRTSASTRTRWSSTRKRAGRLVGS